MWLLLIHNWIAILCVHVYIQIVMANVLDSYQFKSKIKETTPTYTLPRLSVLSLEDHQSLPRTTIPNPRTTWTVNTASLAHHTHRDVRGFQSLIGMSSLAAVNNHLMVLGSMRYQWASMRMRGDPLTHIYSTRFISSTLRDTQHKLSVF